MLWLSVQCFLLPRLVSGCVWLHTGRQALPTLQRVCPSNFSSNRSHVVSGKKPGMRTDTPLIYPFNWTSVERDIYSLVYFCWRRNMKPESCKNLILMDEVLPWWTQPFRNTVKLTSQRKNLPHTLIQECIFHIFAFDRCHFPACFLSLREIDIQSPPLPFFFQGASRRPDSSKDKRTHTKG